ncbi:exocyst complex component EXO70H1-like [Primulina huaijiensis]|uniref:exocyst complex component EXO70H1-like n=1 Tax=Primulina huaijiensis TaxID=1492673 RepID=UPI003CC76316
MPRKGMRSLLFSPKSSFSASPSSDQLSSPSRFGFSPSRPSFYESVMARTLDMVEPMIVKWDTEATAFGRVTSLFYDNRKEAKDFIKCVKNLHRGMQYLITEDSKSEKLIRAQTLMQIAMKRLQKEFYQILSMNRAHLDPESVSTRSSSTSIESSVSEYEESYDDDDEDARVANESLSEVEDVSIAVMSDLRLIAECMISSGYTKECLKIYNILRKSIVDEGIYKLGVKKFTSSEINKMDWEALELRIKNWLNAVRTAVWTLFNGEKILCDDVFATSDSIRESCFAEITREGAAILFEFPENVAKSTKTAPEKVFRLLDMYTGIAAHWPEIDSIFSSASTAIIKQQALTSLIRLGQFVRTSFSDLESAVSKRSSKSPTTGAGVHILTTEVMNYLSILADYSSILTDIFSEAPPPVNVSSQESYLGFSESDETPATAISRKLSWLISVLLVKLDAEAKNYKDISLSHLFLANNLQHVVVKARTSNLKYLLGEVWLTKHEAKIKQLAENYERLGWSHVVDTLPSEPTDGGTSEKVTEIFKKFNMSFDQAYKNQSACVVPDSQLRDDIKISIARKIFRRYREFYITHSPTIRRKESIVPVVRFTPEDVGHRLSDLFFGNSGTGRFSSIMSESKLTYNVKMGCFKILKCII